MQAHRAGSSVGVFLVTGSEAWIDITKSPTSKSVQSSYKSHKSKSSTDHGPISITSSTHWMAESGILDLFVFLGPTPQSIFEQYTALTGRIPLPQLFAIAYHQCRWNYQSEEDVLEVQRRFDETDIPVDVLWLDIEYAEGGQFIQCAFPRPLLTYFSDYPQIISTSSGIEDTSLTQKRCKKSSPLEDARCVSIPFTSYHQCN